MPVGVTVFSLRLAGGYPFQRAYTMILSSELQSDGRDTEPRGTAVKGRWGRAQTGGGQGREGKITL